MLKHFLHLQRQGKRQGKRPKVYAKQKGSKNFFIFGKKRAKFNKNTKTNLKEFNVTRGLRAHVRILELRVPIVIDCSITMGDDSR